MPSSYISEKQAICVYAALPFPSKEYLHQKYRLKHEMAAKNQPCTPLDLFLDPPLVTAMPGRAAALRNTGTYV